MSKQLDIMKMDKQGVKYNETGDYDKMIKMYLTSIEKGSIVAMCKLGMYYYSIKEYLLMKKSVE